MGVRSGVPEGQTRGGGGGQRGAGRPDQFQFSDFVVENLSNKFPKREERQTTTASQKRL